MSARVLGGAARSTEGWTDDLNFEACDAVIDSRVTSSGGANRTRITGAGVREAAAGAARVNHTPIGKTNTLKSAIDMSDAAYWLQNAGGWWTSSASFDKPPPCQGARVTKFVRTAAAAGDSVFVRGNSLSIPAGARSGSVYVYVPSGQGIANFKINCDWQDVEQGTQVTSTTFDQWVRINSTATLAAVRSFLDYCISVNSTQSPSAGFTFYCAAPQESDALYDWIPTGAAPVTVYTTSGLLNEPALVQRITAPNDVSNVAWSKSAMTAPAADTLRETATNAYHYIAQIGAITAGAVCVMYAEVKADGRSSLILQIADGGDALQAGFDLANTAGGYVTTFGLASSAQRAIVALEDGWFGVQASGIVSPSATLPGAHIFGVDGSFSALYTGDITKGLKVRNVNFGEGRFATSPVLTAATATAAAHYVQGAAFTQYYAAQGTYLVEFTPLALTHNEVYWGIGQPSVFNNSLYLVNSSNRLFLIAYSGGVNTVALDLGALAIGTRVKAAITYQSGEIAARMNGGAEQVSSGAMPASVGIEGLLTSPWGGGAGGVSAHMHRRRYRPYPGRSHLYQLTA